MPIKNLTLGLILFTASSALAHDVHYRVEAGDTFASISAKFRISETAILSDNQLKPNHHLRPGHFLLIRGASNQSDNRQSAKVPITGPRFAIQNKAGRQYTVRNGDFDWAIAKRNHITVPALHALNPGIDWSSLQIGTRIAVPGTAIEHVAAATQKSHGWKAHWHYVAKGETVKTIAHQTGTSLAFIHTLNAGVDLHSLKPGEKVRVPGLLAKTNRPAFAAAKPSAHGWKAHWHYVASGENDWIIAHKAGVKLPFLRTLNPGVDLSSLHMGDKVRVPGSLVAENSRHSSSVFVKPIYASHVAVIGDAVTVREEAGHGADRICSVDSGTNAAVVQRDGNWYQLRFPKGTVGWVRGDFLKPVHVDVVARVERRERPQPHYVAASRPKPVHKTYVAVHHPAVAPKAAKPASRPYVASTGRGHRNTVHGLVAEHSSTSSITAMDTDAKDGDDTAHGVLNSALNMRGTRYVWGAASRSATDCSGYTLQVYRHNGVHLPRTSREQSTVGQRVAYNDMKPGDLVFFHTMRGHRVSHVGIYMGDGKFIHASSGGGHVQINSLSDQYYSHRLVVARRVLKHRHSSHKAAEEASPSAGGHPSPAAPSSDGDDKPPVSASGDDSAPTTAPNN